MNWSYIYTILISYPHSYWYLNHILTAAFLRHNFFLHLPALHLPIPKPCTSSLFECTIVPHSTAECFVTVGTSLISVNQFTFQSIYIYKTCPNFSRRTISVPLFLPQLPIIHSFLLSRNVPFYLIFTALNTLYFPLSLQKSPSHNAHAQQSPSFVSSRSVLKQPATSFIAIVKDYVKQFSPSALHFPFSFSLYLHWFSYTFSLPHLSSS